VRLPAETIPGRPNTLALVVTIDSLPAVIDGGEPASTQTHRENTYPRPQRADWINQGAADGILLGFLAVRN
jgi:hypothetical protein